MKHAGLKKILSNAGLAVKCELNSSEWKIVFEQIDALLTRSEQDVLNVKDQLDLSYVEMNKVWDLIQERESLIKSILDASEDTILTIDDVGQIIEFNHAAEKLFAVSKKSIAGQSIFNIVRGGNFQDDLRRLTSPEFTQSNFDFFGRSHERTILTEDGRLILALVFPSSVSCGAQNIYPIYIKDLTLIKATEIELEKSRALIVSSSRLSALGEMAGGIAHEINTPLAVIQLRTDQLVANVESKQFDVEVHLKALGGIEKTVKRISKMVNSLRAFSRDGAKDEMASTSIVFLVEQAFSLCREKFYNHGVKLDFTYEQDIFLNCRSTEIVQVLFNLLTNSFDAVEASDEKWVRVELVALSDSIELSVVDSGKGIEKSLHEKIMLPFFTTKESGNGTGIGLSISKAIVESHGGRVFVDSGCSNTKFTMILPLKVGPA